MERLDISSLADGPAGILSNFTANTFTLDGLTCASMEGFLQSLKCPDAGSASEIRGLAGIEAKKAGQPYNHWQVTQQLHWRGYVIDRHGEEYQLLLGDAYRELIDQCPQAKQALLATVGKRLEHSIGVDDPTQTVLTEHEFVTHLTEIRDRLWS